LEASKNLLPNPNPKRSSTNLYNYSISHPPTTEILLSTHLKPATKSRITVVDDLDESDTSSQPSYVSETAIKQVGWWLIGRFEDLWRF